MKMAKNKGQVSIEYLLLVASILILLLPVMYKVTITNVSRADDLTVAATLEKIEIVSNTVFLKGYPEKKHIIISLPETTDESRTIVGSNFVQIAYSTTSGDLSYGVRLFEFNTTGSIPKSGGRYLVEISAKPEGGVAFSFFKFFVEPLSINVTVTQWTNSSFIINITNAGSTAISNISMILTGLDGIINFDDYSSSKTSYNLGVGEIRNISLLVNASTTAGYHYGELSINEEKRFLALPVTVFVEFVDLYAPIITEPRPLGLVHGADINISVKTDEIAICRYSLLDEQYSSMPFIFSSTNYTVHSDTLLNLSDGAHSYYVRCSDSFGNENNESTLINFELNSTIPQVIIDSPANQTYFLQSINLNATVSKQALWCYGSVDEGLNASLSNDSYTNFFSTIQTINGSHFLTVYCSDFYGNVNSTSIWFTTDLSDYDNPVITNYTATPFPLEGGAENFVLLNVTAMDNKGLSNATFSVLFPNGTWVNTTRDLFGAIDTETYDLTIADTGYFLYNITITDSSGNQASISDSFYVITDWWNQSWRNRLSINISMGNYSRDNELVRFTIDFQQYFPYWDTFDPNTIRVIENLTEIPYDYDGSITLLLNGLNPAGSIRSYYIYFDSYNNSMPAPEYEKRVRVVEQSGAVAAQYWFGSDWFKVATVDTTTGRVQNDWFDSKGGLTEFRTPDELHVLQPNKDYFQSWSYYKIASPYIYYIPKDLTSLAINNDKVYSAEVELNYSGNTTDVGNFTFKWSFFFNYEKSVVYGYQNWTVFSTIYPNHGGCDCDWPKQPGFALTNHVSAGCFYNATGLQVSTLGVSPSKPVTEYWAAYNYTGENAGAILHILESDDMTQGYEFGMYNRNNIVIFNSAWRDNLPVGNHYTVFKLQAVKNLDCISARDEYLKELSPAQIIIGGIESR